MKKYFIRVAKYIIYFYLLFLLIYVVMRVFSVVPPSTSHLLNQRLIVGLLLIGLIYPFLGFKRIVVDMPSGGREAHEKKIYEAIEINGFRKVSEEGGKITFVAVSKLRRILAMYEDPITLTFINSTTIAVTGLRKDVARVQLRLNDYMRYVNLENK
ncbi:hypothetical protein FACS189452_09690 [Bacteroidia bacterium]|nr:hypothetical protein FACS189452_09690 [Bacteroidia bacterium]GHT82046.1 hypothetical protein FACS189467_6960 [Bacteroidia bacterium]